MAKKYVESEKVRAGMMYHGFRANDMTVTEFTDNLHAADVVSKELFEQIKWERDIAVEQLNELGIGLGEKIIKCKDCIHRGNDDGCPMCYEEWIEYDDDGLVDRDNIIHDKTKDDGWCDRGERKI